MQLDPPVQSVADLAASALFMIDTTMNETTTKTRMSENAGAVCGLIYRWLLRREEESEGGLHCYECPADYIYRLTTMVVVEEYCQVSSPQPGRVTAALNSKSYLQTLTVDMVMVFSVVMIVYSSLSGYGRERYPTIRNGHRLRRWKRFKDADLEPMTMNLKEGSRCVVNRGEDLTMIDFDDDVSLAEKKVVVLSTVVKN
ncbi:hypothetical protein BHE74_00044962 [Ensete ventricosum]|nr:hypothetical protein BHE74_00044962 [Ensete ventricosum]